MTHESGVINSGVKSQERKVLEGQDSKPYGVFCAFLRLNKNVNSCVIQPVKKIAHIASNGKKGKKLL